jgi:hypothetical protein
MKKFAIGLFATLGVLAVTTVGIGLVYAANQQLGATYFLLTEPQTYARGDGLVIHKASKTLSLVGNGDGLTALGPGYRTEFDGGDGVDISGCIVPGTWIYDDDAAVNTACTATCGANTPDAGCVSGFEAALADAGDILPCADTTADACTCISPDPRGPESCSTDTADLEGSTGNIFLLQFNDGVKLAWHPIVVQEIAPDMDASSLDIGGDQTADDGLELFGGMFGASGRPFTVGDDPAFQFCVSLAVEDVSGTDDMWIGFRSVEPANATFNSYDTYATIGPLAGDITIETEDDGGGTTTTDTTQDITDAQAAVEYCVKVSDAGVVTYTVDGDAPTATAAYTFDDGIQVIPFVHMLQAATLTGEVDIDLWEVRYQ